MRHGESHQPQQVSHVREVSGLLGVGKYTCRESAVAAREGGALLARGCGEGHHQLQAGGVWEGWCKREGYRRGERRGGYREGIPGKAQEGKVIINVKEVEMSRPVQLP